MKKALLLLLPFTAAALATHAQEVSYGIKGGLNLSNDILFFDRYHPAFYGGGFAELKFNKHLAFQADLLFAKSGSYSKYDYDNVRYFDKKTQGYLNIPVMVKYYITPKLFVEAGPEAGILFYANEETEKYKTSTRERFRKTSLNAGAGIGYKLPFGLGINARYMFGVSNKSEGGSLYTSNLQVGMNYTFKRKK
ncbi:porin family protein [Chitinophaga sp.]|uniref:porin family protein n=1 Tax=Chitinophaga sp. TaxID=1869181 RepID=UPI002F920D7C